MPELPEVETIARQLDRKLAGKKITKVEILNKSSFGGLSSSVTGDTVTSVSRKAKTLIFRLKSGLMLLSHLKMTGQMIYEDSTDRVAGGHPSHDFHAKLPNGHTRVVIHFDDGAKLFFNDLRKFGWVRVVDKEGFLTYFQNYGPDAIPTVDANYLMRKAIRRPRSSIKRFLLDQSIVSGIGNIYADEILFEARLHPETPVSNLKKEQWSALATIISAKLLFATEKGGTTDNDYVNAFGEKGGMQDFLNVYHKTGTPCPRNCGGKIERIKVAGRSTHYCPVCQKGSK